MSKARKEGSLKFAIMKKLADAKKKKEERPAMTSLPSAFKVGFDVPPPPPVAKPTQAPPSQQQPRASTAALLGLSLLGNFDPLFPPPGQSADHVNGCAPFDPVSLGAGCRLKPGGSLLYAYTFDEQLTIVLGFDAGRLGLDESVLEKLWENLKKGIEVYID